MRCDAMQLDFSHFGPCANCVGACVRACDPIVRQKNMRVTKREWPTANGDGDAIRHYRVCTVEGSTTKDVTAAVVSVMSKGVEPNNLRKRKQV